ELNGAGRDRNLERYQCRLYRRTVFNKKEYAKARPLLEYNYVINRAKEYDHAAKSLQVLAAIDLAMHKNDSALLKIREALALIKKAGTGYYLQPLQFLERIYFTASDVFR